MQQWLTNCIPLESYSQRKPVKPVFWLPVNEGLSVLGLAAGCQ
jgi:hypothetical protein